MDQLGKTLLRKVQALLNARPDEDWPDLGRAIGRGPSWISEFKNGQRTSNDLRLVMKMAKFFAVPPGYLLTETSEDREPSTVMLLGAWENLGAKERGAVLQLALTLSRGEPEEHST